MNRMKGRNIASTLNPITNVSSARKNGVRAAGEHRGDRRNAQDNLVADRAVAAGGAEDLPEKDRDDERGGDDQRARRDRAAVLEQKPGREGESDLCRRRAPPADRQGHLLPDAEDVAELRQDVPADKCDDRAKRKEDDRRVRERTPERRAETAERAQALAEGQQHAG